MALTLRLGALWQLRGLPTQRFLLSDSKSYWEWSSAILQGDWLSRSVGTFYQAPGYPYLLALSRLLVGDDPVSVRVLQCVLGAATVAILSSSAWHLTGRSSAAWVVGVGAALFGPWVFYDLLIQKAVWASFLLALCCWLVVTRTAPSSLHWFAAGASAMLGALVREHFLLLLPTVAVVGLVRGNRRALPILLAGTLVVALPVVARNVLIADHWGLTTSQSGTNFYIGNHRGASGRYEPLIPGRAAPEFERDDALNLARQISGQPLDASGASRFWWRRGLGFWLDDPLPALRLTGRKTLQLLSRYEIPDIESLRLYSETSSVLRATSYIHFGWLWPLAFLGAIFLGREQHRRRAETGPWALIAFAMVLSLAVVAFYVMGRYRAPIAAPLFLMAGGLTLARRSVPTPAARTAWLTAATAALLAWVSLQQPGAATRSSDLALARANLALAYVGQQRWSTGERLLLRVVAERPDTLEAQIGLASIAERRGDLTEATRRLEIAQELSGGKDRTVRDALRRLSEKHEKQPPGPESTRQRAPRTF